MITTQGVLFLAMVVCFCTGHWIWGILFLIICLSYIDSE
jgi:hypothetical protein